MVKCPYCNNEMIFKKRITNNRFDFTLCKYDKISKYYFRCARCGARSPLGENKKEAEKLSEQYENNILRAKIEELADIYGFQLTDNVDKIIKAKRMLFGPEEWERCPCDANDVERGCGKEKCRKEIAETGICHCKLFKNER